MPNQAGRSGSIAFFIPHLGCPHQCSFCDQHTISGAKSAPTPAQIDQELHHTATQLRAAPAKKPQIAFFGGSFTAIDPVLMRRYLEVAKRHLDTGLFDSIRLSTRPDCVDGPVLEMLHAYGVRTIELGCQSADDEILAANGRGHTFADIEQGCARVKAHGFELGVQMMAGLYGDTPQTILYTADRLIGLAPDAMRLYPAVALQGTALAHMLKDGGYSPLSFDQMIDVCAEVLRRYIRAGVTVLRIGLHDSGTLAARAEGGYYHPAFGELCSSRLFRKKISESLEREKTPQGKIELFVAPGSVSKAVGHKRTNIQWLCGLGYEPRVLPDPSLTGFDLRLTTGYKAAIAHGDKDGS